MDLSTLRAFFLWCTLLNGGILIMALLICGYAGDWVYRMHGRWFSLPRKTFDAAVYGFIGSMKLVVLLLNLVPFLALTIIG